MAVKTRVQPIARDLDVLIRGDLSPDAQSAAFARFARDTLAETQETNRQALGRVPPHETYVDGKRGAALESVTPSGRIIFEFELFGDVFTWIDAQLVQHSPVGASGRYRSSHVFLADGVQSTPATAGPADEWVFINTQPYARKIERGLSKKAPDGVYQAVAALASKRYGNMVRVRFSYRSPLLGYVAMGGRKGGKAAGKAKRSAAGMERASRVPAIVITPR